jgi:DNA polymerase-1
MAAQRLILVDGSNYIFRAYFALQQGRSGTRNIQLSTQSGMPTGGLLVFANMLMRLYLDEKPERWAVVFDAPVPSFRAAIDPEYKANRTAPPDDLKIQFPFFERIVDAFRLPVIRVGGVEADDVIATLTRKARALGYDVDIFSGDKDLMALVDGHVRVIDSMRDVAYDAEKVAEKFGVPASQVIPFLALRGDGIDNVPGVEGIGDVTAAKLLKEHGSIAGITAAADEGRIKGKMGERLRDPVQRANLARSEKLVALKDDVELPRELDSLGRQDWDLPALASILTELEFFKLLARVEATFESDRSVYRLITSEDELAGLIGKARAAGELALHVLSTSKNVLLGVSLAAPGVPAAYVPVAHRYLGAPAQLSAEKLVAALKPVLLDAGLPKHIHDLKAALVVFAAYGVAEIVGVRTDPMIAGYLLDATTAAYDLHALAKQHLSHDAIPLHQVTGKGKEQKPLDESSLDVCMPYCAEAAELTLALGKLLRPRLEKDGLLSLHDDLELPLSRVLAVMERSGVRVDAAALRAQSAAIGEEIAGLERSIQEAAGGPINVGSPKQLGELLFDKLGLRSDKMRKTKSGAYSTDAEQLEELADAHPVVKMILDHRELTKLKGTYLDALVPLVDPRTSRLHTVYLQAAATTGRLSSKEPNVQNIPVRTAKGREIRRAFLADPGMVLVSADYSQIELRVIAHLSADPTLVKAFAENIDVHAQTAAEVFGIPLSEVNKDHRRVAKAVNYGLGYGQTDFGLSRALDIPRAEARTYIERYFERFARVKSFMEGAIAEAKTRLWVQTILGRRIPIPALASSRYGERSAAERLARNAPIQGSAADILKLAMLACQKLCDGSDGQARMLLTVHDELVFEVVESGAKDFAASVKSAMENAYQLSVPLEVDVGIATSWADAH